MVSWLTFQRDKLWAFMANKGMGGLMIQSPDPETVLLRTTSLLLQRIWAKSDPLTSLANLHFQSAYKEMVVHRVTEFCIPQNECQPSTTKQVVACS